MPTKLDTVEITEETAAELLALAADQKTLDEFYRRQTHSDLQLEQAVEASRRERARFFVNDGARKQKRRQG